MPIFMDLHEVPGVTPKEAIEAHQMDVAVQDKYNCCVKTVWLDINKEQGFCLIEAPNKESVELMHKNTHGMVPNKIIEVERPIVELILGRISDPEIMYTSEEFEGFIRQSPYRTIMNVELKEPFVINMNTGNHKSAGIKEWCNEEIKQAVAKHNGTEVMQIVDGFIASFLSVKNSVKCAIEILDKFKMYNNGSPRIKINAAIGLHTSAPVTIGDNFFGDSIKLTKRLCSISVGGRILLSSAIRDMYIDVSKENLINESIKILSPGEETFLNRLIEITERLGTDESFNVDKFSKEIGLSKAQLYRKVTALTGTSPNVFLRDYRLKKAVRLINTMRGNISEIAFESGFGNPSYFSKCFFKKFGILPSEYASHMV